MTKISLTDDLKRNILQQYHPYILIDLWSLLQEQSELFAKIPSNQEFSLSSSDNFLEITFNYNMIPENINIQEIPDIIIYDYNYHLVGGTFDNYILFQENFNNLSWVHEDDNHTCNISLSELDIDKLSQLNDSDFIAIGMFAGETSIIEKKYQIFFPNNNSIMFQGDVVVNDPVNLKIIESDIEQLLRQTDNSEYMLKHYQKYVSKPDDEGMKKGDFDNIIFTPKDDLKTIIPYEYYKGVFYLRLPYYCHQICLHIISKYYDATDNVALFTTDDIIEYLQNPPAEAWVSDKATRDGDKLNFIADDDIYAYGRYLIKLPQALRDTLSIEIDAFYRYSQLSEYSGHSIGIVDTKNRGYNNIESEIEDQKTLITIQAYDADRGDYSVAIMRENDLNNLQPFIYYDYDEGFFLDELAFQQDVLCEQTVKYFNDDIYYEEYNPRTEETVNRILELQTNNHFNYNIDEWSE